MNPAPGVQRVLRATCPDCLRAACVCACLQRPGVPLRTAVQLLILQHPREQREAKGTARLLHQAVAGSRLLVGEAWPELPAPDAALPGVAGVPGVPGQRMPAADPPAAAWARVRDLLLYPATPGDAALPAPPAVDEAWLAAPGQVRLVVIDGTWRKSRRMLYDSPALQRLPRLALVAPPPSRYRIRRARGECQLCTFEAALHALARLGSTAAQLAPLWAAFDGFVEALIRQGAGPLAAGQPPRPRPGCPQPIDTAAV